MKVPADVLGHQGHIPPSLLHRGRKDKLNLGDEELGPLKELGRVSESFSNGMEKELMQRFKRPSKGSWKTPTPAKL